MNYKILKNTEYTLGDYTLTALRHRDILEIMYWRNAQIDVLRQKKPLTRADQERYFREVVEPTFAMDEPPIMLFSFLSRGQLVGYGGLVYLDFTARRAEVSFLVDPKRAGDDKLYSQDFLAYLTLIKKIAFEELGLNRIFTETFAFRQKHLGLIEKAGFRFEGRLREHIKVRGKFTDSLIHSILKKEYKKQGETR